MFKSESLNKYFNLYSNQNWINITLLLSYWTSSMKYTSCLSLTWWQFHYKTTFTEWKYPISHQGTINNTWHCMLKTTNFLNLEHPLLENLTMQHCDLFINDISNTFLIYACFFFFCWEPNKKQLVWGIAQDKLKIIQEISIPVFTHSSL